MKKAQSFNINTKEYWEDNYKEVISMGEDYYLENFLLKDQIKAPVIASHIEDGSSVVDLGCGRGHVLNVISKVRPECVLTGLDFSETILDEAHVRYPTINFIKGDLYHSPFKDNEFDYAISTQCLEHLDDPELAIKEMARIVKTGGKAMLTTPYADSQPNKEHYWNFEYEDLENMFNKYFSKVWVFPWASGNPDGKWNTIWTLAIK